MVIHFLDDDKNNYNCALCWGEGFGIDTGNLKNASHKYHCLECGETEEIWEDLEHNLVFCKNCGTILVFNEIVNDSVRVLEKPEVIIKACRVIEAEDEEEARLLFFKWLQGFCFRFIKREKWLST